MAKVNYTIYDNVYSCTNNPNMKFRLTLRAFDENNHLGSYDGTEQSVKSFINGAIDSNDVASDFLTTDDLPQSQHKVLRNPDERVISGNNYHMIETLADSCDKVCLSDYHETVNNGKNEPVKFHQYYYKEPDNNMVYVKSYVEGMLVDQTFFNLSYSRTDYSDQGPIGSYVSKPETDYTNLQNRIRTAIQEDSIIRMLKTPDDVYDIYSVGTMSYKYAAVWTTEIVEEPLTVTATLTLTYGTDDFDNTYKVRPFSYNINNYGTADEDCTTAMEEIIEGFKYYLDSIYGPKLITQETNGATQEISAHGHSKYPKNIVIMAHGVVPNYDGTVRGLVQFDAPVQENSESNQKSQMCKGEMDWVLDGSFTMTENNSKFGKGLELTKQVMMESSNVELGGKDFTFDWFLWVSPNSTNGSVIFDWGSGEKKLQVYYESDSRSVAMQYGISTKISTVTSETVFDNSIITTQSCHYALVYRHSDKKVAFFIEGYLIGEADATFERINVPVFFNRTASVMYCGVEGTLDEIRISDGIARWKNKPVVRDVITTKGGTQWRVVGAIQKVPKSEGSPFAGETSSKGMFFDGHSYAEILTPYEIGAENFALDFWYKVGDNEVGNSDLPDASVINPLSMDIPLPDWYTGKKPSYLPDRFSLGAHRPNATKICVHHNYKSNGSQFIVPNKKWSHVAIVFSFKDNDIYVFSDGKPADYNQGASIGGLPAKLLNEPNNNNKKYMTLRIGFSDSCTSTIGFFKGSIDCITFRKNVDINSNSWKDNFNWSKSGAFQHTTRNEVTLDSDGNKIGEIVDVLDITAFGENVDTMIKTITPISLLNKVDILEGGEGSKSLQDKLGFTWQINSGTVTESSIGLYGNGGDKVPALNFQDNYATTNKSIVLGGNSFTIEGWYSFTAVSKLKFLSLTSANFNMNFYLTISGSNSTFTVDLNGQEVTASSVQRNGSNKGTQHFGVVYVHSKKTLTIFLDGVPCKIIDAEKLFASPITFTESSIGVISKESTNSYTFKLQEFRILNNWAMWLGEFKTNVTTYDQISFPVIDMGSDSSEEDDTVEGKASFKIPSKPYDAVVSQAEAMGLNEYYIPLLEYFDDEKYTAINNYPEQINIPTQSGSTVYQPTWRYYDEEKLEISGETSGSEGGKNYYAIFTPKGDYVWRDGTKTPKSIAWTIRRETIESIPTQEEELTYTGEEQTPNLSNLGSNMLISAEDKETDANTLEEPYYYVTVYLKKGYQWPDGTTTPKLIPWKINPQPIQRPELVSSSSLMFTYNTNSQGPQFTYDNNLIDITGDLTETESTMANNGTELEGKSDYVVSFSLKDKRNYCWSSKNNDEIAEGPINDGNDDINFNWNIKRKVVSSFTVEGTTFTYTGKKQGPKIIPEVWDSNIVKVVGDKEDDVGNYELQFVLKDPNNYEWEDGSTGNLVNDWIIEKAERQVYLSNNQDSTTDIVTTINLVTQEVTDPNHQNFEYYPSAIFYVNTNDNSGAKMIFSTNDYCTFSSSGMGSGIPNDDGYYTYGIKINGTKSTVKPITVTWTIPEDDYYLEATGTFTVTVAIGLEVFTWDQIANMTNLGTLSKVTTIGDTKSITLKDGTKAKMILIGLNHNATVEGSKKAHFMFGRNSSDNNIVLTNTVEKYFDNNDTSGGWNRSNVKLRMSKPDSTIGYTALFPDDFLAVVTPTVKWSDNVGGGSNETSNVIPFVEYFTVPSEKEVTGKIIYGNAEEGNHQKQYDYFKINPHLVTGKHSGSDTEGYLLRTLSNSSEKNIVYVNKHGVAQLKAANSVLDIAPIFTVSKKTEDIINIPSMQNTVEILMHFDDENDPFKDECGATFDVIKKSTGEKISAVISSDVSKFNKALQFDGDTYAVQKIPIMLGAEDFTIDFWCYYDDKSSNIDKQQAYAFKLISTTDNWSIYSHRTANRKGEDSRLTTGYILPNKTYLYQRSDFSPIDKWTHIAIVYEHDIGQIFIYWNGCLTRNNDSTTTIALKGKIERKSECYLYLGHNPGKDYCMVGAFDELRIINGTALWKAPTWAQTRRPTNNEEAKVFDVPTTPNTADNSYVLHNQVNNGYVITLSNRNRTKNIDILQNSGELKVLSSDPTVATASVSGHVLTVTGLKQGQTTITLYSLDTDYTIGTVRSFDVHCDASIAYPMLSEATPAQIKDIIKTGKASLAWQEGDKTAEIPFVGTINGHSFDTTIRATLIGIDHNIDKETQGCHSAHFMFDPVGESENIFLNVKDDGTNGWENSTVRSTYCTQFRNCLPTAWRNVMAEITKWTNNTRGVNANTETNVTFSKDRVWLLAWKEIFEDYDIYHNSTAPSINTYEFDKQKRYKAFANNSTLIPKNTWTRSVRIHDGITEGFFIWTSINSSDLQNFNYIGINFCFAVCDYTALTKLDTNSSTFKTTKDIIFDGKFHDPINEEVIVTNANKKLTSDYYEWSGDIKVKDAKTSYSVTIKPAAGFSWSDGSLTPKVVTWNIVPPSTETITVNNDILRLYYKNNYTGSTTVTRNNNSTLTVSIADTNIVKVKSINSNTVTFEAIGLGTTTAVITSPTKGNFGTGTVTVTLNVSNKPSMAQLTPEDIQEVISTGFASIAWDVGDTFPVTVKGTINEFSHDLIVDAVLLGFDHNSSFEGTKKAHFTLGKISTKMLAFSALNYKKRDSSHEYNDNIIRTQLLPLFLECLPNDLKMVMVPCKKQTQNFTTEDIIWIPSCMEVLGPSKISADDIINQKQYDYFAAGNSKTRYRSDSQATLASYEIRDTISGKRKNISAATSPTIIDEQSNANVRLTPCFAIGETNTYRTLMTSSSNVTVNAGFYEDITISVTGTGTVTAISTDPKVATASITGNVLKVEGIATGTCQIILQIPANSTHSYASTVLTVTVGTAPKEDPTVTLSSTNVSITVEGKTTVTATITGGSISSVTTTNSTAATATFKDNVITINGIAEGNAKINVSITGDKIHNDATRQISVSVTPKPISLKPIPKANSTLSFTSGSFSYSNTTYYIKDALNNYSETYHVLSGTISAKDHKDNGNYTVIVEPKKGYQWYEGGTEQKTVEWNIDRIDSIISGETDITLVGDGTTSQAITYSKASGMGAISVKSNSDSKLVTTKISGNTVTFSSVCNANKDVTIVLQTATSQNYNSATLTVTISVKMSSDIIIPVAYSKLALSIKLSPNYVYSPSSGSSLEGINCINNFNDTYHSFEAYYNNQKVGHTGNAGIYTFKITPKEGYVWDNKLDKSTVELTWEIHRITLSIKNPVQLGLEYEGSPLKYRGDSFDWNGKKQYPVFILGQKNLYIPPNDGLTVVATPQINVGTNYKATVTPTINYCWSDGTRDTKNVTWRINKMSIAKPIANAYITTYTEDKEQGPTITNNIPSSTDWVLVSGSNYLAIAYSDTNKVNTEFSPTVNNTEVKFTAVNAGKYNITYALKDTTNVQWSDGTKANVTISYTINRATIPATKVPKQSGTLTVQPSDDLSYLKLQKPVWTQDYSSYDYYKAKNNGVFTDELEFAVERQRDAGTYHIPIAPTKNYKWSSELVTNPFGEYLVNWTIKKADPIFNPSKTSLELSDTKISDSFTITTTAVRGSCSGKFSPLYAGTYTSETSDDAVTITVKTQIQGTYNLTFTSKETANFNAGSFSIPITTKVNYEVPTKDRPYPIVFFRNLWKFLMWNRKEPIRKDKNKNEITPDYTDVFEKALSFLTGGTRKTIKSVLTDMKAQCHSNPTLATIKTKFGVDLTNTDIGSIFGADYGASATVVTYKDFMKVSGSISSTMPGDIGTVSLDEFKIVVGAAVSRFVNPKTGKESKDDAFAAVKFLYPMFFNNSGKQIFTDYLTDTQESLIKAVNKLTAASKITSTQLNSLYTFFRYRMLYAAQTLKTLFYDVDLSSEQQTLVSTIVSKNTIKGLEESMISDLDTLLRARSGALTKRDAKGVVQKEEIAVEGVKTPVKVSWYKTTQHRTTIDDDNTLYAYNLIKDDPDVEYFSYFLRGMQKWWISNALRLINTYFGLSLDGPFITEECKNLGIRIYDVDPDTSTTAQITSDKPTYESTLRDDGYYWRHYYRRNYKFNMTRKYAKKLDIKSTDAKYGKLKGSNRLGSIIYTITHEFIHYITASNVACYGQYPQWVREGMNADSLLGNDPRLSDDIPKMVTSAATLQTYYDKNKNPYSFGNFFARFMLHKKYLATIGTNYGKSKLAMIKTSVTYDGTSYTVDDISALITNLNSKYHRVTITNSSGTTVTSCKNADTYTIHIVPEVGYAWDSKKDISEKTLTWKIDKMTPTITLDKSSLSLTDINDQGKFKVTSWPSILGSTPYASSGLFNGIAEKTGYSSRTYTITGYREGTSNCDVVIKEGTNNYECKATVKVTVQINNYDRLEKAKPWLFMKNLFYYIKRHVSDKWAFTNDVETTSPKCIKVIDGAINYLTNREYKTAQSVLDVIKKFVTNLGSNPTDAKIKTMLLENTGINLSNEDTGSLWGQDIGASNTSLNFIDVIPEEGNIISTVPTGVTRYTLDSDGNVTATDHTDWEITDDNLDTYCTDGINVVWPKYVVTTYSSNTKSRDFNEDEKYVLKAARTWWIPQCIKYCAKYYGLDYKYKWVTNNNRRLSFKISNDSASQYNGLTSYGYNYFGSKANRVYTGHIISSAITLNSHLITTADGKSNLDKTTEDRKRSGILLDRPTGALDKTIMHEFVHYMQYSNCYLGYLYPKWFNESCADMLSGMEAGSGKYIIELIKQGTTVMQQVFEGKTGSALTLNPNVKNASPSKYPYNIGIIMFRYLIKKYVTDATITLPTVPSSCGKTKLTIKKSAVDYNPSTSYTVTGADWVNNWNANYLTLSKVTNSAGTTMTKLQDAGTYTLHIIPKTGYTWDDVGDVTAKTLTWTINRKKMTVTTGTQTGLSGSGTAMTYTGNAQTPTFDVDSYVTKTVTKQTNANTYSGSTNGAKLTPTANYAWSDGTTTQKTVSWTIKRKNLTTSDNPKFIADSISYNGSAQKPEATNFTFDSTKISYLKDSTTGQTAIGTDYDAVFSVNSNYAWSDGTTSNKKFKWAISAVSLKKPTISGSTTFTYNGKAQGPTILNNITATNDSITVTAENYLAIVWTESNKTTTGFSTTKNTTVKFTATDAGKYTIIYTPKAGVQWSDGTTTVVKISYTINKATITSAQAPSLKNGNKFEAVSQIDNMGHLTFTHKVLTDKSNWNNGNNIGTLYTLSCEDGIFPSTYVAYFTPTKNYKWDSTIIADVGYSFGGVYGIYGIVWYMTKSELPFYYVKNNSTAAADKGSGNTATFALSNTSYSGSIKIYFPVAITTNDIPATIASPDPNTVNWSNLYVRIKNISYTTGKTDFNEQINGGSHGASYSYTALTIEFDSIASGTNTITIKITNKNPGFKEGTFTIKLVNTTIQDTLLKAKPYNLMRNMFRNIDWSKLTHRTGTYANKTISNVQNPSMLPDINATVNTITGGKLKTAQEVVNAMKALATSLGANASNSTVDAHLKNNYNIVMGNTDAGAIFGKDIGATTSDVSQLAVIPETGSLKSTLPTGSTVINGVKFVWPTTAIASFDSSGNIATTRALNTEEKFFMKAMNTWWLKNGLNAINTYYGMSITSSPFATKDLDGNVECPIMFYSNPVTITNGVVNGAEFAAVHWLYDNNFWPQTPTSTTWYSKGYGSIRYMLINSFWLQGMDTSGTSDSSKSGQIFNQSVVDSKTNKTYTICPQYADGVATYYDSVITHELVHGLTAATIHNAGFLPVWFHEGSADLLIGIDIERADILRSMAKNPTMMQNNFEDKGSGTEKYVFGYLFFRYLMKNYCTKT